jgi:formate dehydrogenase major subunit
MRFTIPGVVYLVLPSFTVDFFGARFMGGIYSWILLAWGAGAAPDGTARHARARHSEARMNWPLLRQITEGRRGDGVEAMSDRTRTLQPRYAGAEVARSICPYCAVGCGQLVFHRGNRVISIEGDPASPISEGHLCPKGAASYELVTHANRLTKVKYRPAYATAWQEIDLETAMDMIADRVWASRERGFVEKADGKPLMQLRNIAHLGGATLDNEENYLIKKLFAAGLGMVAVSNQARI